MSKFMYKDYYGKRITLKEAFTSYKVMEISFDYNVTRLNLEYIAKGQIKDPAKLEQFNDLLDEVVNLFSCKIDKMRDFRVKRWNHMINTFTTMNNLLGLTQEEMTERALDFALEYEDKEELMELGIRQMELLKA